MKKTTEKKVTVAEQNFWKRVEGWKADPDQYRMLLMSEVPAEGEYFGKVITACVSYHPFGDYMEATLHAALIFPADSPKSIRKRVSVQFRRYKVKSSF